MGKIKRLIVQLHRRSLWQVLAIYLGTCWLVLQVAEHVIEQFSMPQWTYGAALLLLLVGFPVVLATAFVQEGRPSAPDVGAGPAPAAAERASSRDDSEGLSGFLTWRNAILGGVGASMVWTLLVVAWMMFGAESVGSGVREDRSPGAESGEASEPIDARVAATTPESAALAEGDAAVRAPEETAVDPVVRRTDEPPETATAAAGRAPPVPGLPASLRRARSEADEARRAAVTAGAETLAAESLQRGDSLRRLSDRDESAGRYEAAERHAELAREAYADGRERAGTAWRERLDSVRRELEVVRTSADRLSRAFADAVSRQEEAARREGAGDYAGALTALEEAGALYRRAQPATPELPVRSDSAPAEPSRPAPREVVTATLGRLERAFESEDIQAVRTIWTTLSAEQARSFERFFEAGRDFEVGFQVHWETLAESDGRIAVGVQTAWEYYDENARRRVEAPPFEQTMRFEERDGRWVITTP